MPDPPHGYTQAFADFHDQPDSPFYAAEALGLGPVDTWHHLVARTDHLIARVRHESSADLPMVLSPELLCQWHNEIFGDAFPNDAGRLRHVGEPVFFGAEIGTIRSRRIKELRGVNPRRLYHYLRHACRSYNATVASLVAHQELVARGDAPPVALAESTYAVAEIYTKILRAHPWVDGNLRAATVALQGALASLDLPAVEFKDLARHDEALGRAFQGDNRPYAGLSDLIEEILLAGAEHAAPVLDRERAIPDNPSEHP